MFITDDPHRDFDRWDAEQHAQLERLPQCDRCEEYIQDDYYEIHGERLCKECMDDIYKVSLDDYLDSLEDN